MRTPSARLILDELHQVGVSVSVSDDDRLACFPSGKLTNELRQKIREHKTEIVSLLRSASSALSSFPAAVAAADKEASPLAGKPIPEGLQGASAEEWQSPFPSRCFDCIARQEKGCDRPEIKQWGLFCRHDCPDFRQQKTAAATTAGQEESCHAQN